MQNWTDIADADDLPDGGRLCVSVDKQALVVLRVGDAVYAIANTCPHAGRPLEEGEVRGLTITCPYHGYAYNLRTGNNLDYPDIEPPVPTFAARIEQGKVQVSVDASNDSNA
ncbi:MAG: Rieske (2Fe-2S) protein [Phycisphaeraceae bacterium]